MVAPSVPEPQAIAPRRRRRWRRNGVMLLTAGVALWLAGRGLSLLGRGAPAAGDAAAAEAAIDGVRAGGDAPVAGSRPGADDAEALPAASGGEPANGDPGAGPVEPAAAQAHQGATTAAGDDPGEVGPAPAATEPQPGLDADRFHSLCSSVELRLAQGELGQASTTLVGMQTLPLDAAQAAAVQQLQRRVAAALQELGSALHASLQRGEVLVARRLAEHWFAAGGLQGDLPPPLRGAFVEALDWRRPLRQGEATAPQPAPLDRQLRVRLDWRGELVVGSVAQASAEQVTVRVETARGQSFPTVPAVACEPLDADAGRAVEMALVAVAAGEPLLARLWWVRAVVLGVDVAAPRAVRLQTLLR